MQIGADIVKRAMAYPARQIAKNAGVNGNTVINKVAIQFTHVCHPKFLERNFWKFQYVQILASDDIRFGYNAAKDRYEDLMAAGILDPSKVKISQNACI